MRLRINVLLIEDSPDYAELVQIWLAAKQDVAFSLNWTDTLAGGLRRLAQGGVDLVLMDLGLPDSDGFETFQRLRPHVAGIPVIVLSAGDNEGLALRTVQEGAQDYLVKSSSNAESLVRAVQYALVRHNKYKEPGAQDAGGGAKLVGVIGACGGAGATTVACHLALELREQTKQKLLLMDLDLAGGLVGFLTQASSRHTILDATVNINRLDEDCWGRLVSTGLGDIDVLKSPALAGEPEPSPNEVIPVLTTVSSMYGWIVNDLGRIGAVASSLAHKMNELLLVTTAEVPALYQTKRVVERLTSNGIERERMRLVLNQTVEGSELTCRELEKIFGFPVYANLPYDARYLREAYLQGHLLSPASPLRLAIRELACKLAGIKEKEQQKPRRWSLPGLRGRRKDGAETEAREPVSDLVTADRD
jgi:Flp pilus assembly CpaE family ATPase